MRDADPRPAFIQRLVGSQESKNTRVVLLWGVNRQNNLLVPIQKSFSVHLGNEIHREICVVAGERALQPPLSD